MGSLVIECVTLVRRGTGEAVTVRAGGRLVVHQGHNKELLPLLTHVFAEGPAPDLSGARVEFVLGGAAYVWKADFDMGSSELVNRSNGQTRIGLAQVRAHLAEVLPGRPHLRAASFVTPDPEPSSLGHTQAVTGIPPSSEELAANLAQYEERLRSTQSAHETASAMYADLFALLASLEEASDKLRLRVRQLEQHRKAEEALSEFRRLESHIQSQLEASRKVKQLEKQVQEQAAAVEGMPAIPWDLIERARRLESEVEETRGVFLEAEKLKKLEEARLAKIRPGKWWVLSAMSLPFLFVPTVMTTMVMAEYFWAAGAVLLLSAPVGALMTSRLRSARRVVGQCRDETRTRRQNLELAELALMQVLRPHGARDVEHLAELAQKRKDEELKLAGFSEELAGLREVAGSAETKGMRSTKDSTELAQLEQRCRELSPYRLTDSDREAVERMMHELEAEAQCQKQAAAELQRQCEQLSAGAADLPRIVEQVSALRRKLAEWRRWERAFLRIREVIDRLPNVPDLATPGPEVRAALYLERITTGRWTRVQFDPIDQEFRIFDTESGMWIHAERENGAVRSTVHLAYRLCLLDDPSLQTHLPLWLVEPFAELPEAMANATAGLLFEVASRRQVVLICRERPRVRWPEGAELHG